MKLLLLCHSGSSFVIYDCFFLLQEAQYLIRASRRADARRCDDEKHQLSVKTVKCSFSFCLCLFVNVNEPRPALASVATREEDAGPAPTTHSDLVGGTRGEPLTNCNNKMFNCSSLTHMSFITCQKW